MALDAASKALDVTPKGEDETSALVPAPFKASPVVGEALDATGEGGHTAS